MKQLMQQPWLFGLPLGLWAAILILTALAWFALWFLWREGEKRAAQWDKLTPEQKAARMIRRLKILYGEAEVNQALRAAPHMWRSGS